MSAIETREYQTRAIESGRAAFGAGKRAVLFVGPTGCGKTTIFSLMARGRVERGGRVAVFAHRTELVAQAAARLASFGLDVGCNGANASARVQVMSAQACVARDKIPAADLVIFDEAHHYVASEWHRIPACYAQTRTKVVGFSATPERADGVGLGDVFDDLVVVAQIAELTQLGFLAPCEVLAPVSSVDALAMDPWEAVAAHAPHDRGVVVFAPHIKAAHQFADDFAARGVSVGVVHSPIKECTRGCAERRADTLARFAAGALRVVVNVNVLTEGWDCPRAKVGVLARKYGSPSQYLQAVGRILRPDGSGPAMLLDLAGNVALHGPPDEERIYSLTGAACSRWGDVNGDGVRICRTCRAEIPPDAGRCEKCGRVLPAQTIPTSEHVKLERFQRAEAKRVARAEAPECKYTKALGTLYIKALRKGHKRSSAEYKYQLHHRPPTAEMRVNAWTWAQMIVARDKHDAWEPAEQ